MTSPTFLIGLGSVLLAVGVGLGAFGAHALQDLLTPERLETWQTAVLYHFIHALALILIAIVSKVFAINLDWPARLIFAGIIIFSGSLYTLCLTDIGLFGAVTPIGGVCFIAGWVWMATSLFKA
jgi:uncharacterized membrane protein YgdD (TMEM256/DUF423 family)